MSPLPAPISPWSASSSTAWGFQLDRIRSLIAIVIPLPSSESNVLPWLPIECCLILPVSCCPLSVDPYRDGVAPANEAFQFSNLCGQIRLKSVHFSFGHWTLL